MTTLTRTTAICLVLAALAALAGCELRQAATFNPNPDNTILSLYTDPETGCKYLGQRSGDAGIAPRIAADGKTHMGCKGAQP